MKRTILPILLIGAAACLAAEPEQPLNDVSLRNAAIMAEEGNLKHAIMLNFKLLRNSPDQQLRENARNQLVALGLTPQEILKTDATNLKGEELAKLAEKIAAESRLRAKLEVELQFAIQLARVSVVPYLAADDQIKVDVRQKELARALGVLLEISFAENGGNPQTAALNILEALNITGNRVETVRKSLTEQKIPADIEKDLVLLTCIDQLKQRMDSLGEETPVELDPETATRRKQIQNFGIKLYNYVKSNYSEGEVTKKHPDVLGYWKGQSHVPVNQDF